MDELAQVLSDSATLIKRLASPAYLVVGRPPEGCLESLKSESGQVEACTAGVSIELLGDAPRPTYLDAIRLAEGCHDYSGGYSGLEGDAWHNAIDTVVGVLKRAAVKPWDSQTRAVFGVGAEAQAVPVPVAWCRYDEFANSMNHGGSFNGWRDPGAGANKCDMQLYAIPLPAPEPVTECPNCGYEGEMVPAPQAGDVEA